MAGRVGIELHFNLPSPEHSVKYHGFDKYEVEVFFKRDDLIHPFVSGNKWRKLKGYLLEAQLNDCHTLITYGGAFSNHLLATAAAGAISGLKTKGYVRGQYADLDNPVLTMCRIYGMELELVSHESYRIENRGYGVKNGEIFISEGGYGPAGIMGCMDIVSELNQSYDHIFCAVGTGTTLAGISNALCKQSSKSNLHGISVLKGAFTLEQEIASLIQEGQFTLYHNYHHGGYAKVSPELINFMKDFTSSTGILLDPVYTGKMLYAVKDIMAKELIPRGSKVLCLHTGGLTGLMNERMLKYFSVR